MNPSDKNEQRKKQGATGGGLYIALAICILSVICVGVYSAVINIVGEKVTGDALAPTPSGVNQSPVIAEVPSDSGKEKTPAIDPIFPSRPGKEVSVEPKETEDEPATKENETPTLALPTSFTRPLGGSVMKEFSDDVLVYSATMNDYRVHPGVDIQASVGDPVAAFARGVVAEIYEDPLMGQTIVLDHGEGLKSVYQNLSDFIPAGIEVGAEVREGQIIAGVGETSLVECAEGSHLHFAVTKNGEPVDPESFFH